MMGFLNSRPRETNQDENDGKKKNKGQGTKWMGISYTFLDIIH